MATSKIVRQGNVTQYTLIQSASTEKEFIKAVINDAVGRETGDTLVIVDAAWTGLDYYTFLIRCMWRNNSRFICYKADKIFVGSYNKTNDTLTMYTATLTAA